MKDPHPPATWPQHFSPEVVRHSYGGGRLSSFCLALEGWRRGLSVTFHDYDLRQFTLASAERSIRFNDSRPSTWTKPKDYRRLIRKWETKRLLEEAGLPIPKGRILNAKETSLESLNSLADTLGYPLVLKPNEGTMGRGVLSGISSWEELTAGWCHLVEDLHAEEIVMEQHVQGDDYRILVVGEKVLAACRRVPAHVVGDGQSTVQQLIDQKNAYRRENPFLSKGLIRVDYEVRQELEEQSIQLTSTPEAGEHVVLRRVANASAGGDVVDVTAELPEPIRRAAIDAVAACPNIHVAGVDVLYDRKSTASPENFNIIEMNSRPHGMPPVLGPVLM
ncbi:ATP-grasp domain-containing protein [Nesterenkonia alba]|uniref:ATP-grasp domain-containing protein n=1 Tax=Nesterenkonia alba TaxID=515814 RepID=UPI0003B5A310|nr:ATP-grasp domain-containing protein [Nesterenkonia alba]